MGISKVQPMRPALDACIDAINDGIEIADGAITTEKLADGSVTDAKLANGAVTYAKLTDAVRKGYVRTYDTVFQMQADSELTAGMTCHTNGFHTSGDGGAAYYTISENGTANGMDVLALQGELFATLIIAEHYVTPEQFGAYGDGATNDSAVFNAVFATKCDVVCSPSKTYYLEDTIHITNKCVFEGNGASFKLKPYSSRHQVFIIEADGTIVRDISAFSEFTGTYNGRTPSDCNQLIFIAADNVSIENIKTDTVFSTIYLHDGDSTIKKNIRVNNIVATNGQFNIFARYVDGLTITNSLLSSNTSDPDFHQLYIASDVSNAVIENMACYGKCQNFISLHPSNLTPEEPNIDNITFNNVIVRGSFNYGIEFRSCRNIRIFNAQITLEDVDTELYLIRHEACENIVIKNSILNALNGFILSPNPASGSYDTPHVSNLTIEDCIINFIENRSISMIKKTGICKIVNSIIRVTGSANNPYVFSPDAWDDILALNCTIYSVGKSIHIFSSVVSECVLKLINCKAYTSVTRLNFGTYSAGSCYVYDCTGYGFTHCVSGADNFDAITGANNNSISSTVIEI